MRQFAATFLIMTLLYSVQAPAYCQQASNVPSEQETEAALAAGNMEMDLLEAKGKCLKKLEMAEQAHSTSMEAYAQGDTTAALLSGIRESSLRQDYSFCQLQAELTALRKVITPSGLKK